MRVFICQQNINGKTKKTASLPTGLDGTVVLVDGYNAPKCLRYCHTVKIILSGKIKLVKARIIWKYVGIYMST